MPHADPGKCIGVTGVSELEGGNEVQSDLCTPWRV